MVQILRKEYETLRCALNYWSDHELNLILTDWYNQLRVSNTKALDPKYILDKLENIRDQSEQDTSDLLLDSLIDEIRGII